MPVEDYRPDIYIGRGDRKLPRIENDLYEFLTSGRGEKWDPLVFSPLTAEVLSEILVELAEDIHADIGIWTAYEQYNREFFGTPLPLMLEPGQDTEPGVISPERIAHLVWVFAPEVFPSMRVTPQTPELAFLSEDVSEFLSDRFTSVPRDSGVAKFLKVPVRRYYEVKRRLVWLGTKSYLFRRAYEKFYFAKKNEKTSDISVIDEFVNEATTPWSGLGVIDILAKALDIEPERKAEIRTWYERHYAFYKIERRAKDIQDVRNLITNTLYRVRIETKRAPFNPGAVVSGSLVKWNDEWYWSGEQQSWTMEDEEAGIRSIREGFVRNHPEFVFRYAKDLAERAMQSNEQQRKFFISYFGDDLAVFRNPDDFSREIGKFYRKYISTYFPENAEDSEKLPDPAVSPEMAREDRGVGVFFDARDGMQIMTGFDDIESGFRKKGRELTPDEVQGLGNFLRTRPVGADFVRKMVQKHGDEFIAAAFNISDPQKHPFLEYILRRHKGECFRNVYPPIHFHGLSPVEGSNAPG